MSWLHERASMWLAGWMINGRHGNGYEWIMSVCIYNNDDDSYTLWMINERLYTHDVSIGWYLKIIDSAMSINGWLND